MKKSFLLLSILPMLAFAATNQYVCPNTYQTVLLGDSMAKVQQACGKPAKVESKNTIETQPVQLEQWVYEASGQAGQGSQYSPELLVTFKHKKVIQISVTNKTHTNSFPCYSMNRIAVGTSTDQVLLQCGSPRYVNTIQRGVNQPVKITTLTYNFGAYKPLMLFTFKDDKLTAINMGQLAK